MTNTHVPVESTELGETLAAYGIDHADAMQRMLNNNALFKQLAQHYLDDKNYESLVRDMQVADYETAYTHAHTLKGVAGNLSFRRLHELAAQICSALGEADAETAQSLMAPLGEAHTNVCAGLDYWQGIDA